MPVSTMPASNTSRSVADSRVRRDYRFEQIHKPRKHQTQRQLQQIQPAAVFAVYNHLRSDKKTVDHKRHVTKIHSCALADRVGYGHNC